MAHKTAIFEILEIAAETELLGTKNVENVESVENVENVFENFRV